MSSNTVIRSSAKFRALSWRSSAVPRSRATSCKAATMDEQSERLARNEEIAPRPTAAECVRTLIQNQKFGTVCTVAASGPSSGYPSGALMPYAADEKGRVMACLSNLSGHKRDLQADGRATVVVANAGFSSMSDARCTLTGTFSEVTDEAEAAACREAYMAKHPEAYWVDFGDFSYLRMDEVVAANYIGGFGRAAKVKPAEYWGAQPDPVAQFSGPVCSHMNADHADSTAAVIKHYVGIDVSSAKMLSVDKLGMNTECQVQDTAVNVRVTFPQPALDRKSIKDRIVEMTRAAAAAGNAEVGTVKEDASAGGV